MPGHPQRSGQACLTIGGVVVGGVIGIGDVRSIVVGRAGAFSAAAVLVVSGGARAFSAAAVLVVVGRVLRDDKARGPLLVLAELVVLDDVGGAARVRAAVEAGASAAANVEDSSRSVGLFVRGQAVILYTIHVLRVI